MKPFFRPVAPALLAALLVLPAAAPAGEAVRRVAPSGPRTLTLNDAVQIALRQNPDIQRQLQEIQRTRGVVIEVTGRQLPNVSANGNFLNTSNGLLGISRGTSATGSNIDLSQPLLVPLVGGGTVDLSQLFTGLGLGSSTGSSSGLTSFSSANSAWSVNIQASQLIYDGGATPATIRAARLTRDNAYYQLRETVEQTVNTTSNQFSEIIQNEALIRIQQEQVRLLESQLKDQQNRFEAGTVPRFDVLQAEVALANQRPLLITAQNNFRLAQIRLARTLGIDYRAQLGERPPFRIVGRLDVLPISISIPEAVDLAIRNRPFLRIARQNIDVQQENLTVAKAGYLPTIRGTASAVLQNDRRDARTDLTQSDSGYTIGLTGTWNVWDGGQTYGRVRQARATLLSTAVTYEDSRRQVEQEVQDALLRLRQSRELVASQQENVGKAEEAVRLSRARLSAGAGTQLDVLNSQVQLAQAEVTETQARYSYVVALADLRRTTGTSTVYRDNFTDPVATLDEVTRRGAVDLPGKRRIAAPAKPRPENRKVDALRAGAQLATPLRRRDAAEEPAKLQLRVQDPAPLVAPLDQP